MSSDSQQDFALAFLSILFEGAPFILLGILVSGFVDVYLPSGMMERFLPRRRIAAVLVAGLMGAVFPVCECAVVPVIRRLVKKGLPVSCALTYMLAAPIVNPITALSTWKAFQGQHDWLMTGSRLFLGYWAAVGVGMLASRFSAGAVLKLKVVASFDSSAGVSGHDHGACCGHDLDEKGDGSTSDRVLAALRSSMRDFVDVAVYFTVGVAITALFNTGIAPGAEWLDGLAENHLVAPAALMALAFILSLCSTSDAFIAATLAKFSWGAKLAFLTFGPMMDVKLLFLYQSVFRKRFILFLLVGLFVFIWLISILWQFLFFPVP